MHTPNGRKSLHANGSSNMREAMPLISTPPNKGDVEAVVLSPRSPRVSSHRVLGVPSTLLAGAAYCAASMGMVLLNKMALSSFSFRCPNSLLLFQCALCVVLAKACEAAGLVRPLEPLNKKVVRVWLPVNVLFVGMIGSSFWALRALNVAMVTVLKNLTNLFTVAGDYYLYGRTYGAAIHASMALMALSAAAGAATDLAFSPAGYAWQVANCLFTAAYSLYMRGAMDRVAPHTAGGKRLDELSMVYLNNALSLPFVAALAAGSGELGRLAAEPDLRRAAFLAVAAASGVIGFAISFCSLWFLSTTTPTIYSLVGSLNKVPLALLGLLLFDAPWSAPNLASILVGLAAGVAFAAAKSR